MTTPNLSDPCIVYDGDGNPINTSANLRGIRRYVGQNIVEFVDLKAISKGMGVLHIVFDDGATFETPFASYSVLVNSVRNWRNLYGAPLRIEGESEGEVEYKNPALA